MKRQSIDDLGNIIQIDRDFRSMVLHNFQFTLHACLKGNKLDFHRSMGPGEAPAFYEQFMQRLRNNYSPEKVKVVDRKGIWDLSKNFEFLEDCIKVQRIFFWNVESSKRKFIIVVPKFIQGFNLSSEFRKNQKGACSLNTCLYRSKKLHFKDGKFGAMMSVQLENDGPVTISLDSHNKDGNGS